MVAMDWTRTKRQSPLSTTTELDSCSGAAPFSSVYSPERIN